jgi:hypothetical protein
MHGLRRNADAFGLTISTRSAQNAILPAKSLERARQMFRETVVLFEAQFVEQSLALAEATLELLASFDIPQYNFAGERLELNVIRAAACASRPTGADCLNEALHAARQEMHFFDRSEEGQLPTYIEKYLATIEILTRSLVGDPFAEGFPGQTELRAVFASPFEPDEDLYLTAAQLLGRALISYWDGET